MPLTAEQRAEINRENAKKSTGPRTPEGKAASRRNATKHGLRAEALALPNEDPAVAAARADAWNDYYRPQSPGAQHLVNACVAATLLSDRCQRYHAAALSRQIRDAELNWEVHREERTYALAAMLKTDPETAVRRLTNSAHGCRYLIERWEALIEALDDKKNWTTPECEEAIRLQGFRPELEHLKRCPPAWLTRMFGLLTRGEPSTAEMAALLRRDCLPDLYRDEYCHPDPAECVQSLREMACEKLEPLRAAEQELRTELDDPDFAAAGDRALILHDGPSARLFLRYHAESRTAFHRAYGSLLQALDRDASEDADETESESETPADVSPNEPIPDVSPRAEPAEPVSPNKANPARPVAPKASENPAAATPATAPSGDPGPSSPVSPGRRATDEAGASPQKRRAG